MHDTDSQNFIMKKCFKRQLTKKEILPLLRKTGVTSNEKKDSTTDCHARCYANNSFYNSTRKC